MWFWCCVSIKSGFHKKGTIREKRYNLSHPGVHHAPHVTLVNYNRFISSLALPKLPSPPSTFTYPLESSCGASWLFLDWLYNAPSVLFSCHLYSIVTNSNTYTQTHHHPSAQPATPKPIPSTQYPKAQIDQRGSHLSCLAPRGLGVIPYGLWRHIPPQRKTLSDDSSS